MQLPVRNGRFGAERAKSELDPCHGVSPALSCGLDLSKILVESSVPGSLTDLKPEITNVTETNRSAARRALAHNRPDLESSSPKYKSLLEILAYLHLKCGEDSFELRYNLRPPKDRLDKWRQELLQGVITEDELRARLKADAERPIDLEMLTTFCKCYQEQVAHFSEVLQKVVIKEHQSAASRLVIEREIDEHVEALSGKLPLWRENLETVFEYLEERQIISGGGLVTLGGFEGTSTHWLAQLIFTRIREAWNSCKEVAERSRRDARYLYAASASDLFNKVWLSKFPTPQSISERLRQEFVLARAELKRLPDFANTNDSSAERSSVEESLDNESREIVLVGEVCSLVGKAGHIFRQTVNSDWGIDGEIEFKDKSGRATGRRLYLQLKSGNSYLVRRGDDEVFTVKNPRHLQYWTQHEYPVMLVIRQSNGQIRWIDVSAYLKSNGNDKRQIIFRGQPVTIHSITDLANKLMLPSNHQ